MHGSTSRSLAALGAAALAVALPVAVRGARGAESPLPDGFYRYPSIGGGSIVFASEGDLWTVPSTGGLAQRLTAHEGEERFPKISPDGRSIAFTAQYDGNDDVFVMPAAGGEPVRLTVHPSADQALGWTEDGKVLFRSRRDHPHGDYRVYTIDPGGGIPAMVPLEPAAWVSFEPGGSPGAHAAKPRRVAMQKIGLEFHNWKRYRGGEAEDIWVGTISPPKLDEVTKYDGKDAFPMWAPDGRIYFVTDRWGRPNLASMRPDGSDVRRLTWFEDYDVRWPAMGDGKIVYQHKMDLWVHDLRSGRNEIVPIRLPSDRLQVRERFVDPMKTLGAWSLSKDGERIALETRGDLFVARTRKKGLIRRITENSSVRTRAPSFSPDGKWIAAWSEVDGEEQLFLFSSDNSAPAKAPGSTPPGWHYEPIFSPDGSRLAWGDEKFKLVAASAGTGAAEVVDASAGEITEYAWSPDSRYVAYTVTLANEFSQVRVWDGKEKKTHAITSPMINSFSPAWDPKGKFLYILSDRWINPHLDRYENRFIVDEATIPCVVALRADERLPFAPRSDLDPPSEDKEKEKDEKDGEKKEKKDDKKEKDGASSKDGGAPVKGKEEKPLPIRIDFEGIETRLVQAPVPPGNYDDLAAVEGKLHWISRSNKGLMPPEEDGDDDEEEDGGELRTLDLDEEKVSTVASGVVGYEVSRNGKVLVYQTEDGFTRIEAGATSGPKGDDAEEAKIDLDGWSLKVNPRLEWKQMLREAWRLQRDFFYDPKMHGVDWEGVWRQYGSLSDRISTRDDLSDLLGEMLGELSVGHAYHWGGDTRRGKSVGTGLLAADLDYDGSTGFWKIRKIYAGDAAVPEWSSPLSRADLRVEPGQWLVAIDGRPLVKGEDYLRRLANRADREVELSIATAPKLDGARRIVVKPVSSDTKIRYATWIHESRDYVDRKSGGQIGYLHLYDMGGLGLRQFARDFAPQWNKRGLIIDDRWNHGGDVAPMILAHLDRKVLSIGSARHGGLYTIPDRAFRGHMAVLINRQGGSDCETLALGFKDFKLGPVIGTRTWGGWIGIRGDKPLRDGGGTSQPEYGGWDPQGKEWQIEGHGVDPDVELDLPPEGFLGGGDAQLDYAIRDLMEKIKKDPMSYPAAPPIRPR